MTSGASGLDKLVDLASEALERDVLRVLPSFPFRSPLFNELSNLLFNRNGFYAFESALHIFPAGLGQTINLETWNSPELWKKRYGDLTDGLYFFGEDIFGNQFCLAEEGIFSFDAETGKRTWLASNLEEWAKRILNDFNFLTGYPLAHKWQVQRGAIVRDYRLIPRIPFVCGGAFDIANLDARSAVESMTRRARFAQQIKDLPDGSKITYDLADPQFTERSPRCKRK